ncbi:MAG: ECF-type sigma factor [Aureliella sp.]
MLEPNPRTSDLFAAVYDELRRIAQHMMSHERCYHTLSATALVNETYVRLERGGSTNWDNRGHFFGAAAEGMRRILIDRARAKQAAKRSANRIQAFPLESAASTDDIDSDFWLDLNSQIELLSTEDPLAADLLKLRIFAGRSVVEAGELLGLKRWSAYQTWDFCVAWLETVKAN